MRRLLPFLFLLGSAQAAQLTVFAASSLTDAFTELVAGATATALERASQSHAAVAAALESRTRVLDDLARVIAELARSVERNDERAREKLDDILRRLAEIRPRP